MNAFKKCISLVPAIWSIAYAKELCCCKRPACYSQYLPIFEDHLNIWSSREWSESIMRWRMLRADINVTVFCQSIAINQRIDVYWLQLTVRHVIIRSECVNQIVAVLLLFCCMSSILFMWKISCQNLSITLNRANEHYGKVRAKREGNSVP